MPKLLCIGHITLDTILFVENVDIHCDRNDRECTVSFAYGAKIPVSNVHDGVGGGASNVVIGTKLLGIDSSIFSVIGSDRQGLEIFEQFNKFKIPLDKIEKDNDPTDQSSILSYGTERTIFTYNADRAFSIKSKLGQDISNIYVSSVGKNVDSLYDELIEIKHKHPKTVIFYNPGSKEIKFAHHAIQKLLPFVDYLLVNVEEGCTILNPGLHRDDIEMEDLISMLNQKGIKNIVLTDGVNGVNYSKGFAVEFKPAHVVPTVEKTGAGDAFASGFISAILHEKPIDVAVDWGIINSASAVQKPGAQNGLLNLAEMMNLTEK